MYLLRAPAAGPAAGPAAAPAAAARGRSGGPAVGPPLRLYLTEPGRGLADFVALPWAAPWLAMAPRGDGHGVLVLPGLLASDTSTVPLRRFLRWLGYDVHGWDLGRNLGPTDAVLDALPQALAALAARTDGPVSVVGWSLGGIYARELAREHPATVRQVITMGSPFALSDPRQSRAGGAYLRRSHRHAASARLPTAEQVARPIGVASTAVYSRHDGIVCWQNCIEPETALHQNVEVRCSHLGFGVDPATLWLIADRLAVPADRLAASAGGPGASAGGLAASAGGPGKFRPAPLLRPLYPGRR